MPHRMTNNEIVAKAICSDLCISSSCAGTMNTCRNWRSDLAIAKRVVAALEYEHRIVSDDNTEIDREDIEKYIYLLESEDISGCLSLLRSLLTRIGSLNDIHHQ